MSALFVSDLHLDASRPAATEAFLDFLQTAVNPNDRLYILGDLFEYWIGDDDPNAHYRAVLAGLRALTDSGARCFVMHGNRDFMLGEDFTTETGTELLFDPTLIYVGEHSVLIGHGDLLCSDDLNYQRLRRIVRNPLTQSIVRSLPLSFRHWLANRTRARSKQNYERKAPEILDVNQKTVEQTMREFNVDVILHGHTHRRAIHRFELDGQERMRIVLGDWYQEGSVLRWDDAGPAMAPLSF